MRYESLIGKGFDRWSTGAYSPGQLEAFSDFQNSFILLSGAYRSGKSEIGARMAIRHAMFFPNSKVGILRAYLASLRKSTLVTMLELIHPSWVKSWSNTFLQMELLNGSSISFIGADSPDRLGSIELTFGLIDEASELSEESLGMIQGRLSGSLVLPNNFGELPDNIKEYVQKTIGIRQVVLACNPKSTGHYLYKRFVSEPQPGHVTYNSNSISNPNLPEVYLVNNLSAYVRPGVTREWVIEQVRRVRAGEVNPNGLHMMDSLTPFGQRNLLGLWVALEGAIYEMDKNAHVVSKVPAFWGVSLGHFIGGDFGFHNPRLAVLSHHRFLQGDHVVNAYVMVDAWSQKNATGDDLVLALEKLKAKWNAKYAYLPHDQPGIKKTAKKTLGSSFVKNAKNSVNAGINVTSRFINQNRLLILDSCTDFDLIWAEFSGYTWKPGSDGDFKDEPVKAEDHYPDAVRYLIYTRHYRDEARVVKGEAEELTYEVPTVFPTGLM